MNRKRWIVPLGGESDLHPRIAIFPHAGGSANFYLPLARALSTSANVSGVQYPGRQERHAEPALKDLSDIADEAYNALVESFQEPLVLFGHSMGAIVAFEVAKRYAGQGDPAVAGIIVSGRVAPDINRSAGLELLDDDEIVTGLVALASMNSSLLQDQEIREMILSPLRTDYQAIGRYRYSDDGPLNCPVRAYAGLRDPQTTPQEVARWGHFTTGSFASRTFDGGHFFVNDSRDEVADSVSQDMRDILATGLPTRNR